jgi:hypothetical protein
MTDSKMRIFMAVLVLLFLAVAATTMKMGKRIRALDAKVEALSQRLTTSQQAAPPADAKAALRGQMAVNRARLLEINSSLHKEDREKYGEVINTLYQQARARDRGEANPADRVKSEQALSKLMEEYPDANATGMIVAERALEFAMRMKTADVEYYFNTLSKKPKFQRIVTDMGVEAYPSLLIYLTRQYIREGHREKAEELIQRLEKDYGDQFVADKGRAGEPEWRQGSEMSQILRRELTGLPGGPQMGGPPPR